MDTLTALIGIRRPRLLDAFCCGGGASLGYHQAGFDVTGVDLAPQPSYPFTFHQGDAIAFIRAHGHEFDLIALSPPCQHYSPLNAYNHHDYPDLIAPARDAVLATGRPYVIENVEAARPELRDPILLCGPMFGLNLYRHRLFESNLPITAPEHAPHGPLCVRNGYLPTPERPYMSIHGGRHSRAWQHRACHEMGLPHLAETGDIKRGIREISEAIPPAYTRHLGAQLLDHLAARQPLAA
ncbi:DNA methylase [Amycolatopsis nivea]